jgi:hypothetical protein
MERLEPIGPDRRVPTVGLPPLTPLEREQERQRREEQRKRRRPRPEPPAADDRPGIDIRV